MLTINMLTGMRWCDGCHEHKSVVDFYSGRSRTTQRNCKNCCKARAAESYRKNRAAYIERAAKWRLENPEKFSDLAKASRVRNRTKLAERREDWRAANRERSRGHTRNRRARKLSASVAGPVSCEAIAGRFAVFGNVCCYCGAAGIKLEADHVKPLSKGGLHIPANIRPACKKCNVHKCAKWPLDIAKAGIW